MSRRRMRRIRMRDDWTIEMWILLLALIVLVFMAPKLARMHEELHHPTAQHR